MSDKDYYLKHREERLAKMRDYYKKNSDVIKSRTRKWYYDNRERALEYHREYEKKNYETLKISKSRTSRERWRRYREEIYEILGGKKCKICGFADERALCIDHINNDGYKERSFGKWLNKSRKLIRANPERYQILCFNCNQIKKIEHEKEKNNK